MARTKQTARKSTGGKAPRAYFTGNTPPKPMTITDHTGHKIIFPGCYPPSGLGFFPFQVYILDSAKSLATDAEFPMNLRGYIMSNDACIRFNENCRWRLEVLTCPQATILDCIHHHEKEKAVRKSVGLGPIMLNLKELIVIDTEDWETTGLLTVEYTAQLLGRHGSERDFENHVYDNPSWEDEEEELALPGLRKDLVVKRYPHINEFAGNFLQKVWDDEGHEWALSSLMERNVALGWPDDAALLESNTLPSRPVAEQITKGHLRHEKRPRLGDEDEDEDCEDEWFSYEGIEDVITYGEKCDKETGIPKSILHAIRHPVTPIAASIQIPGLFDIEIRETVDGVGVKCVDCSSAIHAASEKHFSYNFYIIGRKTELPQALFALLNQKHLKRIPWKLHFYNMPDLSAALSHYTDEMVRRPDSGRSPVSYTGLPDQPQSHVFLYLDENTPLDAGPKIVTQNSMKTGVVLEVLHAGSWENAAQMLFTYLILCTESSRIMTSLNTQITPSITASISLTPHHPSSSPCHEPAKTHLRLTFTLDPTTTRKITINTYNTILTSNPYLWDTFLCIVDPETGEEVSLPPPPPSLSQSQRALGVEQLQHISFPFSDSSPARHQMLSLRSGEGVTRTVVFEGSCLMHRYREVLTEGKSYEVRLRYGLTRARGMWGGEEGVTGSLAWGKLMVVEGGEIARFAKEGESEYPEPKCHLEY